MRQIGGFDMTFLISDIHGDLYRFEKLLKRIHFDNAVDQMIIIGDIIDRNLYGIELLDYISPYLRNQSMKLLMGNHEYFAKQYLEDRLSAEKWSRFGGEATVKSIQHMSSSEREKLYSFINRL